MIVLPGALFSPSSKNKKGNSPWNTLILQYFCIFSKESCFHISGNGNPKKCSYMFSKESFPYISGNEDPHFFYVSGK